MIGTASPTATTDLLPNIVRVAPPSTAPAKASRLTPRGDFRRPHAVRPSGGDLSYKRSRRVDFWQSATHGGQAGHVLGLRVAERLRRLAATAFGLPRSRVWLAEHFLTLRQPGPTLEQPMHCDEVCVAIPLMSSSYVSPSH